MLYFYIILEICRDSKYEYLSERRCFTMLQQISAVLLTVIQLLLALLGFPVKDTPQPKTDYPCVFVHGLGGWGAYDTVNDVAPYWGMTTGSVLEYLESEGYDCYAASVGPISSAWDRACELYAQLTGTTVDYGEVHSAAHNHDRYGKAYEKPLFAGWGPDKKIHLFGHSFGGATIRLFTQIACEGAQEEIDASPSDVSPFFRGGMRDWIYSVTTLAAPHNGTTMDGTMKENDKTGLKYMPLTILAGAIGNLPVINGIYDFQLSQFGLTTLPGSYQFNVARLSEMLNFTSSRDHAAYDLSLRGAYELNCRIKTQPGIYYFSYAACATEEDGNGNWVPIDSMETMFKAPSFLIGRKCKPYTTSFGLEINAEWQRNDGLVNTISALRPLTEEGVDFDSSSNIQPGIWNVMPVVEGRDHMAFMGGLLSGDGEWLHSFYLSHMKMLDSIAA